MAELSEEFFDDWDIQKFARMVDLTDIEVALLTINLQNRKTFFRASKANYNHKGFFKPPYIANTKLIDVITKYKANKNISYGELFPIGDRTLENLANGALGQFERAFVLSRLGAEGANQKDIRSNYQNRLKLLLGYEMLFPMKKEEGMQVLYMLLATLVALAIFMFMLALVMSPLNLAGVAAIITVALFVSAIATALFGILAVGATASVIGISNTLSTESNVSYSQLSAEINKDKQFAKEQQIPVPTYIVPPNCYPSNWDEAGGPPKLTYV